jgi:hypothetical protein
VREAGGRRRPTKERKKEKIPTTKEKKQKGKKNKKKQGSREKRNRKRIPRRKRKEKKIGREKIFGDQTTENYRGGGRRGNRSSGKPVNRGKSK